MKVLLVAPQPFYQERGTPIAVKLLAETLCELGNDVDLLVYHAGANIDRPRLRLIRAARPWGVDHVPIGPSWQKLLCDATLIVKMIGLLRRNRYDVVHAVEEAVFPAAVLVALRERDRARDSGRAKLVYDMDSSLSDQLIDKWAPLKSLERMLRGIERFAVRRAAVVLAVCEDLAVKVRPWSDVERVYVLPDVPLEGSRDSGNVEQLRNETIPAALLDDGVVVGAFGAAARAAGAGATSAMAASATATSEPATSEPVTRGPGAREPGGTAVPAGTVATAASSGSRSGTGTGRERAAAEQPVLALYVGNLERYQGIDLLLDAIACLPRDVLLYTAVIGGDMAAVKRYRTVANELGIAGRVRFFGARPVADLNAYLAQADILLSPRILGENTPMKIYSYMQAGKAIVATDIRSHTQALDASTALLVPPDPPAFSAGLERLARDAALRERLGAAARTKAECEYSLPVYRRKLASAYARLAEA